MIYWIEAWSSILCSYIIYSSRPIASLSHEAITPDSATCGQSNKRSPLKIYDYTYGHNE